MDLVLAVPGLILLAIPLIIVAAVVRLNMGSPVLFRQVRPGLHARPFTLLKFRTMIEGSGEEPNCADDAQRLTRLGRFLRRTSLDELPEVLNVVAGDMSLVGPRPLLMRYLDRYTEEQMRRHHARPGVTGWAQVNGRNSVGWDERFRLDLWYVDNWSLALDLKVLWMTIVRVVRRRDIAAPGHATMPEFRGSKQ